MILKFGKCSKCFSLTLSTRSNGQLIINNNEQMTTSQADVPQKRENKRTQETSQEKGSEVRRLRTGGKEACIEPTIIFLSLQNSHPPLLFSCTLIQISPSLSILHTQIAAANTHQYRQKKRVFNAERILNIVKVVLELTVVGKGTSLL